MRTNIALTARAIAACTIIFYSACATTESVNQFMVNAEGVTPNWYGAPIQIMSADVEITEAVNLWNEQLGFLVLEEVDFCDSSRCAFVLFDEPDIKDNAAETSLMYNATSGQVRVAFVRIRPEIAHKDLDRAIKHELGHVLGLAHDLDPASLMFPYLLSTPWIIDTADIEALRVRYGVH